MGFFCVQTFLWYRSWRGKILWVRHWPFPQESHSGLGNFYFTSTGFNCIPLEWDFCRYLFTCMFDTKQDECCFNDQLNSFLWQIWLWDISYGAIYVNCVDLISRNFQYPVFEAVFPNDYLLDFGHLMLLLSLDKWNCFWTTVSGSNCLCSLLWRKTYNIQTWNYEEASLIFVGIVCKKILVSMLHCLKQLFWNRIVSGIFAPGIRKSDSLFTDILIDVWWLFFDSLLSWLSRFWSKIIKTEREWAFIRSAF